MKRIILCIVLMLLLVSCNSDSKFSITYNLDGGILENAPSDYEKGKGLVSLPIPTKEGYNFLGWYFGDEKVESISNDMKENVVLDAKWEKIKNLYSVKYNGYDSLNTFVNENETLVKPVDPIKDGYTFDGWYLNNELFDFNSIVTNDISLDAKFSVINYSINYELEDGTFVGDVQTSYNVENYSELNVPSKDGYIFLYFVDAKGDIVESLENRFEDLYLTAIYEKIEKVVTFELGSYQVVKYFDKGTVLQNELFELIDGLIYDARFDFEEFTVSDDVNILASEYIIYEIELQTEDNVLLADFLEGHYIYKNVIDNSDNVVVRPFVSEDIIVDAIYWGLEFTDNLVTLLIKEGFDNRTYQGSENPNLVKIEYENGIWFPSYNLTMGSPNLKIVILPESVRLIGGRFFIYCDNLEIIYVRGNGHNYGSHQAVYNGDKLKIAFERELTETMAFVWVTNDVKKEIPVLSSLSYEDFLASYSI